MKIEIGDIKKLENGYIVVEGDYLPFYIEHEDRIDETDPENDLHYDGQIELLSIDEEEVWFEPDYSGNWKVETNDAILEWVNEVISFPTEEGEGTIRGYFLTYTSEEGWRMIVPSDIDGDDPLYEGPILEDYM
ncbi:MAG: hypothetical protein H0Z24_06745 [Thermosipho sp. (in: Bacteria)]|nr:hypothetical protein [Thermosipho sp. (in: thermotogales)]